MTLPRRHKDELASTYFVQDQQAKQELARLTLQDRLLTAQMGGVLPEQPTLTGFQRVLDVSSSTEDWLLQISRDA